jgi:hypothetical protein
MNIAQVEEKVKALAGSVKQADFLYDLLECYGKPKASITRLKMVGKGSYNLSKNADEVLWKKQVYFKATNSDKLLTIIDGMKHADVVAKHQPRFIIAINATHLLAIDTKTEDTLDIPLAELNKKFDFFLPWTGLEKTQAQGENPADVKAAEKMAKLFDLLRDINPATTAQEMHWQNVFLSRILFCYFAEDTGIFPAKLFTNHIGSHTAEDGGDLDDYLRRAFDVMNQESRKGVPEYLADFPYVNGGLFADKLPVPKFNRKSRAMLIECGADLNWSEINPDIFGSMIQAAINPKQRAKMGMHYTSVPNIMKVIEPLFLNELKEEFEKHFDSKTKLEQLLFRLEHLKIFDPACGSGNFLIIAYKELRQLEMEIFKRLQELSQEGIFPLSRIKLSQFYGIELDDFAHEVAILSLWLAEHQMNLKFKATFGHAIPALPLKVSGNIISDNALNVSWENLCPPTQYETFILGNPPYLGSKKQTAAQKADIAALFAGPASYKNLDYIACWFLKAARYIQNGNARAGLVTTNSIVQGDQVAMLWPRIWEAQTEIIFAVEEFKWGNNAKNAAGVTCVVVGLGRTGTNAKWIYKSGYRQKATNISPYLTDASNVIVSKRNNVLCKLPEMVVGNMSLEEGHLKLETAEKDALIAAYPGVTKFIRKLTGGDEFLYSKDLWAIWIEDEELEEAQSIPPLKERIEAVRKFRIKGGDVARTLVHRSHQFRYRRVALDNMLLIPCTSSERREYLQVGMLPAGSISLHSAQLVYQADLFTFAILSSKMHMLWAKAVGGTLDSRVRYSNVLVYNNFPIPKIMGAVKSRIEQQALEILSVREEFPELCIADMYDPDKMPAKLKHAHEILDAVLESAYQGAPFAADADRLKALFKLYEKMTEV